MIGIAILDIILGIFSFFIITSILIIPTLLFLIVSGIVLIYDNTRIRLICDPTITIAEYDDYFGISPQNINDNEDCLTIHIRQLSTKPKKFLKSLEIVVPNDFILILVDVQNLPFQLQPKVWCKEGLKHYDYSSNEQYQRQSTELNFFIRANKDKPFGRNTHICNVILKYKYG